MINLYQGRTAGSIGGKSLYISVRALELNFYVPKVEKGPLIFEEDEEVLKWILLSLVLGKKEGK